MMKYTIIALSLLCFAGCAKDKGVTVPTPAPVPPSPSLQGSFSFKDGTPVVGSSIDTSGLTVGETQSSEVIIHCDGTLGNSGDVDGVPEKMVRTEGTAQDGTIQFGHLAYQGASDSRCKDASKEGYRYTVNSDGSITFTMLNYPYSGTYSRN